MRSARRFDDDPDVVLVAAAQRGERDALDALLRRHYATVVQRCRLVLNNEADANDAAQNALVAVARGIGRFDGTSSFTTWLYRVATNAALDEVRRRNRRPEPRMLGSEPTDPDGHAHRTYVAPSLADARAGERFESVVDRDAITAALAKIAPEFRAPLVLRDLCGLDYAEIAEVLAIPPGTVRSRIARGRASLAPHLQRSMTEPAQPEEPAAAPTSAPVSRNAAQPVLNESGNFPSDVERQRFHDGR